MNLHEIETRLQTLIEVDLLKVLPGKHVEDLNRSREPATAIQQNSVVNGGATTIPDVYKLLMHPETAKNWGGSSIYSYLAFDHDFGVGSGVKFTIAPTVTVSQDEHVRINDVEIFTSHRIETMAETNATPLDTGSLDPAIEMMPENSFLIVEGVRDLSS